MLRAAGLTSAQIASTAVYGTTDISGTPGNGTITTALGKFAIATAATAATITYAPCTASSFVFCQVISNDTTLKSVSVVPGAGSFVVTGNAAATANCTVICWVLT
jgi:hypothetical protein